MQRPVGAVHAADGLLHLPSKLLVSVNLLAGRHGDLDIAHAITQRRVAFEYAFQRLDPTRDAFGVIEAIDAKHDATPPSLAPNGFDTRAHVRIGGQGAETRRVNPHREHTESHFAVSDANAV